VRARNECLGCGHSWPDRSEHQVIDQTDIYGNRWKLAAYVWMAGGKCTKCESPYFKRQLEQQ
jgi:hypothetical protein